MSLYAIILIGTFFFPFLFSFERKISFRQYWKQLLPALLIVGVVYAGMDIFFTMKGIWGFNPQYYTFLIWHIPVEEWLFFIVIPYASIFLHYTLLWLFPASSLSSGLTRIISGIIISLLIILIIFQYQHAYTLFSAGAVILSIGIANFWQKELLRRYFLTFLIILVPFCMVNAILTGSFIEDEVVWYNPSENLGLRIFTIPIEDIGYAFSLILFNLLLMNGFYKLSYKNAYQA